MQQIFDQIVQLGIVVESAEAYAALMHDVYGVGPWQFYTFDGYRTAVCNALDLQIEAIEPTGDNRFSAFLKRRGTTAVYDIHYTLTGAYADTCALLRGKGHDLLEQTYPDGSAFSFCDTYEPLGVCLKISEAKDFDPRALGPRDPAYPGGVPEKWYPADGAAPTVPCPFAAFGHICVTTAHALDSMKIYNDEYGIGPWIIVDLNEGPIVDRRVRGKLVPHVTTATNCFMSRINVEINGGEDENSGYSQFVRRFGPGVHHIMMLPAWPEKEYLDFLTRKRGFEIEQSGTMKASGESYYYIDSIAELGADLETFSKFPSPADPPEFGPPLLGTYPPQD